MLAEAGGVERVFAELGGHVAEGAEGARNEGAAVWREGAELGHGSAELLALGLGHTLDGFIALDDAVALFWRHLVETVEVLLNTLLLLRRELVEAGFLLELLLLLLWGEVVVVLDPLAEVLIARGDALNGGGRALRLCLLRRGLRGALLRRRSRLLGLVLVALLRRLRLLLLMLWRGVLAVWRRGSVAGLLLLRGEGAGRGGDGQRESAECAGWSLQDHEQRFEANCSAA